MSCKLSILIPTLPERSELLKMLSYNLWLQSSVYDSIEIVFDDSIKDTIGRKRNNLLQSASGEYIAFVDDDDRVSDDYIERIMYGIKWSPDCCSLKGIYTVDGKNQQIFEHSLKYNEWKTNLENYPMIKYERYPNHLNCIRADIAKQFKFPEINHGEDHNWAKQIHESGLLKTEHYIESIIYYYDKRTNHVQPKR